VTLDSERARARAEAAFKKQVAHREGLKAAGEYRTKERVTREKTARLKALRLARDEGNKPA
jgi:hypothetical protein